MRVFFFVFFFVFREIKLKKKVKHIGSVIAVDKE